MATARRLAALKSWHLELWAFSGSILSFVAMAVLLACFNRRPVFDWKGVTLNTIVAVLSACMKTTLSFAVTECVGQWKWILFSRDARPLMDFERIDLASRGPLGSLSVLWTIKDSLAARIGPFALLLLVGLDPFSQQLLQLEQGIEYIEDHDGTSAVNLFAEGYNKGDVKYHSDDTVTAQLDMSMEASILDGFLRPMWMIHQQQDIQCSTGNCTWPQFDTLGVCHWCSDLTAKLKRVGNFGKVFEAITMNDNKTYYREEDGTAFVLPNGHFLANINGCVVTGEDIPRCLYSSPDPNVGDLRTTTFTMTSFGTGDPNKTVSMQDIDTLIWSMSVILPEFSLYFDKAWPTPIHATECALYYCVKTINAEVKGNSVTENATVTAGAKLSPGSWKPWWQNLSEHYQPQNIPPADQLDSLEFHANYSRIDREDLVFEFPHNSSKPQFRISESSIKSISAYFQSTFKADFFAAGNGSAAISDKLGKHAVGFNGALTLEDSVPHAVRNLWHYNQEEMLETFATLATSMTNDMRRNRDLQEIGLLGLMGVRTTYYRTEWGWIALHGMALVAGMLSWAVTFANSKRPPLSRYSSKTQTQTQTESVPVWKNSSLAAIGCGSSLAGGLAGLKTTEQMEERARTVNVRLPSLDEASALIPLQVVSSRPSLDAPEPDVEHDNDTR